jgi:3-phosphoinositide dependent protein kinase-1
MATTADYWVGSAIGEGSYGKVVHARHKETNKDVAIKVVTKQSIKKEPSLLSGVWKERGLLTNLKSEYVVSLWASFHDSECIYFVMECLAGGDLTHVVQCGLERLNEWSLAIPYYALQVISALEFIHKRHVIHADLKPDNVLVSTSGRIKLADFGSAVELNDTKLDSIRFMGTADYASPEVVRGMTSISFGVDLWSLGCLLYAMWEGASPFHDQSDALAIKRIVEYKGTQLQAQNLNGNWETLIRDLLSPEVSNRLGMADCERTREGGVFYASIRDRSCLQSDEEVAFRASEPSWWTQTRKNKLRDGAEGWSIFLLS